MIRNEKGQFIKGVSTRTGTKHTPETIKKIKEARRKQGSNVWNKGTHLSGMLGKHHTLEGKKNIGRPQLGHKNHQWKGGVTPINYKIRNSFEYKLWRKSVFERDKFRCIWCASNKNIQADHIKRFSEYPELRFAIDNGRTLCYECHKKTENYGNRKK